MLSAEQNLKLNVLANGIQVDPLAEEAWREEFEGPMSLNEYASTSGICMKVEDGGSGVWLNAPYTQEFTQSALWQLQYDGGFVLQQADQQFRVGVIPVPAFHSKTYIDGQGIAQPYTNLGVTHTDRIRISPLGGCGMVCKFCNIPYEAKYQKKPNDELLEVIKLAENDPQAPARHVLISGGTPRRTDEPWIDDVYEFIASQSPIPVDVMMPARHDMQYPSWLREKGVNSLSVNMEISDPERALQITPSKARRLGREHYLSYLERAVDDLGVGAVQSLMVFGSSVEPIDSTLEGVQDLAERGVIPVLSPFRPDARTPMEQLPPASEEEMKEVYERSLEICDRAGTGVKPGPKCVPCHHNTVAFDDGSDFYVPLGKSLLVK
jgi:hypothetical protein